MTLRDLATTETTALVDRLLAAMTAELDAATCRLQADADAALAQLRSDLANSVADVERAARGCEEAERARDAEAGRRASLQRDLDEATGRIAAARAEAIAETEKLQADANARIEAVIAAAAKRQAEDQETIGALTDGATTLQADVKAQVDAIAADAARQQAEANARIEALMATAASVRADAEAQIDALTAAAARQQTEAAARIDALTADAARQQTEATARIDALVATVESVQAEAKEKINAAMAAAAARQTEAQDTQAKIDAAIAAAAKFEAEANATIEALTRAGEKRQADARQTIDDLVRQGEQLAASLVDVQKRLDAVAAERDNVSAELERSEAARTEQARTMRDQVLQLASMPMDRLRTGFYRLTTAPSVADALTALVETLGSEFSRAALFQVTGNRLQGVHQVGFDFESDVSKIVVPLARESPLTEAVRSGRVQGLTANELTASTRTLFGGTPGFVLVLPVAICGEIGAVVYADDSDDPEAEYSTPERRVKFAEVLLWHAVPLLARLSIEENTRAELREYSIQLFTDLERAYAADTTTSPSTEKLRGHLEHNLDYARQMFEQQAEAYGRNGSGLFDEQLEALIKSQGTTPFVRDLAAVAHITVVKAPSKTRRH
jgi:hypothetical protein